MTSLVFSSRVKAMRENNKYTRVQLAKKVGVSAGYIGVIESRGLVPSWRVLYTLAKALNTTEDYLLPEENEETKALEIAALKEQIEGKCKEIAKLEARLAVLEEN